MARQIETVLASTTNKDGLTEYIQEVSELTGSDPTIYGSAGTAAHLNAAGVEAHNTSELTGYEPFLDHRMATISKEVAAGLLADVSDETDHQAQLDEHGIPRIDVLDVDLYPLIKTTRKEGVTEAEVVHDTDVGGILLLHAAAKGRRLVTARPEQRKEVIEWLRGGMQNEAEFRRRLASIAEWEASRHLLESVEFLGDGDMFGFMGEIFGEPYKGENGPQTGRLFVDRYAVDYPLALHNFAQLRSDVDVEVGHNNRTDVSRAVKTIVQLAAGLELNFDDTTSNIFLVVKHGNASAAAISESADEAIASGTECDPLASFGGTVMLNFVVDKERAQLIMTHGKTKGANVYDLIAAPEFTDDALDVLHRTGNRLKLVTNPALASLGLHSMDRRPRFQSAVGGDVLVQDNYTFVLDLNDPDMKRSGVMSLQQARDEVAADGIARTSNSNAMSIVSGNRLIGNGVGQQARVYASELAVLRATRSKHDIEGGAAASDSFCPFPDAVEVLEAAGIASLFTTVVTDHHEEILEPFIDRGMAIDTMADSKARGFAFHAS